jgi:hypothetical protein
MESLLRRRILFLPRRINHRIDRFGDRFNLEWALRIALSSIAILVGSAITSGESLNFTDATFTIQLDGWSARIVPSTLAIYGIDPKTGKAFVISSPTEEKQEVSDLSSHAQSLSWRSGSGLVVRIVSDGPRLRVALERSEEGELVWPKTGDRSASGLVLPLSEGLYIPVEDDFWKGQIVSSRKEGESPGMCFDTHGALSMPFWGYTLLNKTLTYIVPEDLHNDVCLTVRNNQINADLVHNFRSRDGLAGYEIIIAFGEASPVSPALEYRHYLDEKNLRVTLAEKTKINPNVKKLVGATHAYLWGDGNSVEALERLQSLGFKRMMLIYDQDHVSADEARKLIRTAESMGFVIGPYDSFANAQPFQTADGVASKWDDSLYPMGCIIKWDGATKTGFGGRGCELSSQALKLAEPKKHYLINRINKYSSIGANGYFLDCDGFGDLWDDFSPEHSMTPVLDQKNRLERMHLISSQFGLILGTESAAGWSTSVIHFSHGTQTIQSPLLWKLISNPKSIGGWGPSQRPDILFKEIDLDADLTKMSFDAASRLPLYEVVFHDSVISLDRWEFSPVKIKNLAQERDLLRLLYGAPSLWNFDLKEIDKYSARLKKYNAFFYPIHSLIGDRALTQFDWLTEDRLVQRVHFENVMELTANFSEKTWKGIGSHCIMASWMREDRTETYCPDPDMLLYH